MNLYVNLSTVIILATFGAAQLAAKKALTYCMTL